jgi:hypothetical protein
MEKIVKREQLASHPRAAGRENWSSAQAYVLAVFCLVLGVALGYLFRGSASPATETAAAASPADGNAPQGPPTQAQLAPEQQKAMVDQAVAPLLATLKYGGAVRIRIDDENHGRHQDRTHLFAKGLPKLRTLDAPRARHRSRGRDETRPNRACRARASGSRGSRTSRPASSSNFISPI